MKQTVYLSDFRDAFKRMNRADQFSYDGLECLFDYLTELERCDDEYELDVIGLCCDFAESTAQEIASDYQIDYDSDENLSEHVREFLDNEGVLIGETDNTFVYHQF